MIQGRRHILFQEGGRAKGRVGESDLHGPPPSRRTAFDFDAEPRDADTVTPPFVLPEQSAGFASLPYPPINAIRPDVLRGDGVDSVLARLASLADQAPRFPWRKIEPTSGRTCNSIFNGSMPGYPGRRSSRHSSKSTSVFPLTARWYVRYARQKPSTSKCYNKYALPRSLRDCLYKSVPSKCCRKVPMSVQRESTS